MNEHDLVKREKIMEAEDLSGYSNEEKLTKFLKIYREKIVVVNEFFTKKLEEFEKAINDFEGSNNFSIKLTENENKNIEKRKEKIIRKNCKE